MVAGKGSTMLVGLALLTGGVLRCWNSDQSFWWDEIWSTMTYAKAQSLWNVVSSLGYYFNNHILYSLLARAFISVLGESEFVARLPAVLMGLLAIVVLFQFGKAFLGVPAGCLASLLLALSAFHIDHSSEARGYSGLVLFSLLSSYYFIKGLKENRMDVLDGLCSFYRARFLCTCFHVCRFSLPVVFRSHCFGRTKMGFRYERDYPTRLEKFLSCSRVRGYHYAPYL